MPMVAFDGLYSPQSATATTAIYSALRNEIIALKRRPGDTLHRTEIADAFGVSSMPVHDAVRRLGLDGLVETVRTKGTFVTRIPLEALPTAIEVRKVLEQKTVSCAAERATPDDVRRLRLNLDVQREAASRDDHAAFYQADENFHALIAEVAHHPHFWIVTQKAKVQIDRCRRLALAVQNHADTLLEEHEAIVAAIADHDPRRASDALSGHFSGMEAGVRAMIAKYPEYFEHKGADAAFLA